MQPQTPTERRSERRDRRAAGPATAPGGLERRSGERRQLPRARWQQWPSLLASAALGVVVAVWLQAPSSGDAAATTATATAPSAREPARSVPPASPRFTAREAAALRDEAERLTPAAVALDEQAALRWWPVRGVLDLAVRDPDTADAVRDELRAAQAALDRVGL